MTMNPDFIDPSMLKEIEDSAFAMLSDPCAG